MPGTNNSGHLWKVSRRWENGRFEGLSMGFLKVAAVSSSKSDGSAALCTFPVLPCALPSLPIWDSIKSHYPAAVSLANRGLTLINLGQLWHRNRLFLPQDRQQFTETRPTIIWPIHFTPWSASPLPTSLSRDFFTRTPVLAWVIQPATAPTTHGVPSRGHKREAGTL